MAERRSNKSSQARSDPEAAEGAETLSPLPEMIRRAAALGLSGFFMTEGALRRALGDTVPKDWVDFAASQGERTRAELMDRIGDEMARAIRSVDMVQMLDQLLTGRTIEVQAKIRLGSVSKESTEDAADADSGDTSRPLDIRIKTG